jgi:hypothetical protein
MLAFEGDEGQGGGAVQEGCSFSVVAVTFFGKLEVDRFPTREQAEWRAKELNVEAERSPRGYVQYLVQAVEKPTGDPTA